MAARPDPTLDLAEWAPDLSSLGTGVSSTASGVIPKVDGWGPFKSLSAFTNALPANCRGYFFARRTDGSIAIFAGTSTNLYLLDNTTFVWANVSKGGGPYGALVSTDNWDFKQFNNLVIAVQINTVPQVYTLGSSAAFGDLGGSPPQASHVAIINRFVVLTGLLSNTRRVQWCDLDGPTTWTAGVGLSDFQDLPDGGNCHGISGGDAYGVVFQDESIRSLIYAPGSSVTFQIVRISTQDALYAQYSVINAGSKTFFISGQGFKVIEAGGVPVPIGKSRVDTTFFADVDESSLNLVIGATDPRATRVYWAYKSKAGNAGLFDKIMCYDWSIGKAGRWSLIPMSGQYLASLARPGVTLEGLDMVAPGALNVTGAANNGAGLIRLTLNQIANANFAIAGQNFIVVYGVTGTVEANGTWKVTIIDATHIDLIGSAFVNAYVSGGHIGGSLDALPFSLDSVSTAVIATLSAFGPDSKLGFFDGPNIEAIMETEESDGQGYLVAINDVRPLTDCPNCMVSVGGRLTAQAAVVYGPETVVDDTGACGQLIETRYARARVRMPAGSVWTYARGVQPDFQPAGDT